jgi:tetratricopeptide (TPR) repeat protein
MNKFEQAENSIQKALDLFPENGIYWGALAKTQEMLGNKEGYQESLEKATIYFPTYVIIKQ